MLASRARILRKEKYDMPFPLLTATSLINDEKIPESSSTNMIDKIYRVVEKGKQKMQMWQYDSYQGQYDT